MRLETDIVIEYAILITVPVEVPKRIVRREIFKLDEQIRENVLYRLHELVHEFVHLEWNPRQNEHIACSHSGFLPLEPLVWDDERQCKADHRGNVGYWFRDQDRSGPEPSSEHGTVIVVNKLRRTVEVGLMPAPAM